jgi:ABC-type branched-subunit amino acid transport system ATPase component
VLDVVSVTRDYGGVRAVDAVSLSLRPGQILAVIGQNGSGKTTLVNVITGVHRPTSGRIIFDGREVTGWPLSAIARLGVARTFQNLRLFEALSVRDNVLLGLGGRGRADHLAERTLEQLGVGQFADALVSDLSHGERRRVEIARALVADPALLVLDEPTAGLTSAETEGFLGALERVRTERRAALVIEHNLDAVGRIADEVLVMHQGRQIARGPVAAALGEPAVRRLYLGAEA